VLPLLLMLVVAAGAVPAPAPSSSTAAATTAGLRALDGDTLAMADGRRLRLVSVDTPETGRPGAEQARAFSAAFLEAGPVRLDPEDPPLDRYGRLLADLRRGEQSLSQGLVEAGLAWAYRGASPSLLDSQVAAVEHRRGVHRGLEAWRDGPLLVTGTGFHALGCSLIGGRRRDLPVEASPERPLKEGRSPCRRCLPWPPRGWPVTPR
jgi:endonuclease YncB( thermonuclease family)